MRYNTHGHSMIRTSLLVTGAAMIATVTLAAPAQAAAVDSRYDICAALRNGTTLASIETTLEAKGYTATNAGALTGNTIRVQCPDQTANATAQAQIAG